MNLAKVRNVLGILLKNSGSRRARKLSVKTLGALPPHDDLLDDTIQLVDPEQVRVSRRTLRERAPRASQPQRSPNNLPQTPAARSPPSLAFPGHLGPPESIWWTERMDVARRSSQQENRRFAAVSHGASRTRTGDLLGAIQALSQLSYSPAES